MDINEQNKPDSPAVPEQPAADESLGQAESQPVPEATAEEPAPVACRIPEVEAPIEPERAEESIRMILTKTVRKEEPSDAAAASPPPSPPNAAES